GPEPGSMGDRGTEEMASSGPAPRRSPNTKETEMRKNRAINSLARRVSRMSVVVTCVLLPSLSAHAADWPNPLCVNLKSQSDRSTSDEDTDGFFALIGPTGRLRAAINYANAIDGKCLDPATGQVCP